MNNFKCRVLVLAAGFTASYGVGSYEISTHWRLSVAAFEQSVLKNESVSRRLGIDKISQLELFTPAQKESAKELLKVSPTCDPKKMMTLSQLLACGAMYEDIPGTTSFNHFYDPVSGAPLNFRSVGKVPKIWGYPTLTSPDWALEDQVQDEAQRYSFRLARKYFLGALTTGGIANIYGGRNDQWAMLFETLGHVIHHIQDMAQPQHTRNDQHGDWALDLLGSTALGKYRHPSRYEKYSMSQAGESKIDIAISSALPPVYPKYADLFSTPRSFWTNVSRGLAEYSNHNFVSSGRNFAADSNGVLSANAKYSSPTPSGFETLALAAAFGSDPIPTKVAKLCEDVGIEYCEMTFYANRWNDPITNTAAVNRRAATESIFDEDLIGKPFTYSWDNAQVTTTKAYALNQLNFDTVYPYLIPRAVAYSSGLLNYFFRGQMEIGLPSDGIYAVADHHAQRCKDACGFNKVKMRLRNSTPGEDMGAGSFRAVAKFHRNNCYQEDLSGDPDGSAFAGLSCRSFQEEVVVSDLLPLASLAQEEERELSFTFPVAIPINATDLYLQVVFQGTLGQEPDAVAVATKDIAEPNYFAFTNVTDKAYDFVDHTYHALPYKSSLAPDPIFGVSIAFRDGGPPLAQITQLDAANHAQLAFLTDPGRQYVDIRYSSHRYTVGSPIRGTIPVSEFVGDSDTSTYGRTVVFTPSRGMYRNFYEYHRLPPDFTIYDCRVEVELCAQSTMIPFTPAGAVEWTVNF